MRRRYAAGLVEAVAALPVDDLSDLAASRAAMKRRLAATAADLDGLEVSQLSVPGWEGDPEISLEVLRPLGVSTPLPAVFHVHGGGFVMGGPENSRARMARLSRELGVVVVSTSYRLAPEHPYPAALHDVVAALRWVGGATRELGVDPRRIAIHGISAGAGLAAGAVLHARDHGGPDLCFQYLAIPQLDDRMQTSSMRSAGATANWDRDKANLSWTAYLGAGAAGSDAVEPYAAPARATDLTGLPPAYVSVMEFDPLRDEGISYAARLLEAGVDVELHLFPGTYHGSSNVLTAPVTQRELAEEVAVLRAALGLDGDQ